jgi:hypothetical protein
VLRRNVRIGIAKSTTPFVVSTFGSHHIRLVNAIAHLWNELLAKQKKVQHTAFLKPLPLLLEVESGESFGAVSSEDATTFGNLLEVIKTEPEENGVSGEDLAESQALEHITHTLNIDPLLLFAPHAGVPMHPPAHSAIIGISAPLSHLKNDDSEGEKTGVMPAPASSFASKRKPEVTCKDDGPQGKRVRTFHVWQCL